MPAEGFVPNEKIATSLAEIFLVNIYGNTILLQRPFKVHLGADGYWIIDGKSPGPTYIGGLAHIEVSKVDGRVRNVYHGK